MSPATLPRRLALLVLCTLLLTGCRRRPEAARLAFVSVPPPVGFVWTGALTSTSVRLVAGLRTASDSVRLVLNPEPDSLPVVRSALFSVPEGGTIVRAELENLAPGVPYHYGFEVGTDTLRGADFRTPEAGPFSFDVGMSACALTGSENPVFDAIREAEPLFFLHLGDLHYENITVNSRARYRRAVGRVLRSRRQSELYRSLPIAYMWDDHDFGPNDSDRTSPGREAARLTYQEMVPHYPLKAGSGNVPIYQAFTMGRVRFIMTDLRSERDPRGFGEDAERTMMGVGQKAWFKQELLDANERYPVIAWVNTVPWITPAADGADNWGGYAAERREIADFIRDSFIRGVVILAGDAHMMALDDGTHSDFATNGGAPIPVVQAAPLDRQGTTKGGPYTFGPFVNNSTVPPHDGQWVRMQVEDEGGSEVCLTWTGYRVDWTTGASSEVFEWGRCFAADPLVAPRLPFEALADSSAQRLAPLDSLRPPQIPTITVTAGLDQ